MLRSNPALPMKKVIGVLISNREISLVEPVLEDELGT